MENDSTNKTKIKENTKKNNKTEEVLDENAAHHMVSQGEIGMEQFEIFKPRKSLARSPIRTGKISPPRRSEYDDEMSIVPSQDPESELSRIAREEQITSEGKCTRRGTRETTPQSRTKDTNNVSRQESGLTQSLACMRTQINGLQEKEQELVEQCLKEVAAMSAVVKKLPNVTLAVKRGLPRLEEFLGALQTKQKIRQKISEVLNKNIGSRERQRSSPPTTRGTPAKRGRGSISSPDEPGKAKPPEERTKQDEEND